MGPQTLAALTSMGRWRLPLIITVCTRRTVLENIFVFAKDMPPYSDLSQCKRVNHTSTTLLREIKRGKPHFVLLQETHFKTHQVPRLTDSTFTRAFHATNDLSKSKGVSILVNKDSPFELMEQMVDPKGRFLILKGKYEGTPITIRTVYFPNKAHLTFCKYVVQQLQGFTSGCLILGGDFNIPLNPLTDTSNGTSSIRYKILKQIKMLLHSLQLVEIPQP